MFEILLIISAVIMILYGIFVSTAGTGTFFFLIWEALGMVCILLAVAWHFKLWSRVPSQIRIVFDSFILVCAILLAITLPMVLSAFVETNVSADRLIVLGAQVTQQGPKPVLKFRLDKAIGYLNEHPDTICICSGGMAWNEPEPEAVIMKEYLVSAGISNERIQTEERSQNTAENLKFCREMIGEESSVAIISNNFHCFRAGRIAKKAGFDKVVTIAAPSDPRYLPNNVLRECIAIVKDFVFQNI